MCHGKFKSISNEKGEHADRRSTTGDRRTIATEADLGDKARNSWLGWGLSGWGDDWTGL